MNEPPAAYFAVAYLILAYGCFLCTKGLYKEISARIVLAIVSPLIFVVLGPLIAAALTFVIGFVLLPFYKMGLIGWSIPPDHMFGTTFVAASILSVWGLWKVSRKQMKKKRKTEPGCGNNDG